MKKRLYCFLACLLLLFSGARAQTDSINAYLVTCEPGKAIYELYGHTAIWVENLSKGTDIVFNYGLFDFSTPHFAWRFSLGQTDYILGGQRLESFLREYSERGTKVYAQQLNLDQEELNRMNSLLLENTRPENRVYRYNFLYNNCATMAIDKIQESINGTVTYRQPHKESTFRTILTSLTCVRPWSEYAVNTVLGAETDQPLQYRQDAFAPLLLMDLAQTAYITTADTVRPLVSQTRTIVNPDHSVDFGKPLFTPFQTMLILFLVVLLVTLIGWYKNSAFHIVDIILFGAQGLAGLLVAFLFFFSEHPAVGTNWLVICLNPLPLIFLPFAILKTRKGKVSVFFLAEAIICTAFILFTPAIPQHIQTANLILIGTFALRGFSSFLFQLINKHKKTPSGTPGKRIMTALLLMFTIPLAGHSQNSGSRPKLVVGIVVDQLDRECLSVMRQSLGTDGIMKLWVDGYNRPNATFDFDDTDRASAIASIYTGASPFQHGIVAEKWMDPKTLLASSPIDDGNCNGINTIEHSSPRRLLATNLADEIKLATGGQSKVCAIAAQRDASVLAGGHEADVAIWMNSENYSWCSSDYYGAMPKWVESLNDSVFKKTVWEPLMPMGKYPTASANDHPKSFSYTFRHNTPIDYATSPLANERIADAAIAALDGMELGQDDAPDLLALSFYAGNYRRSPNSVWSVEQQDIYLRLDRDIAKLITAINSKLGTGNVLYFLTSTGYTDTAIPQFDKTRIPTGTVSMEKASALLNLYLSSKYDSRKYVKTFYGNQIYLDHNLIEDCGLSMHEVLESSVDLLVQVSGIRNVILMRNLMSIIPDAEAARKRNSFNSAYTGDIIIDAIPGWGITDENEGVTYYRKPMSSPFPMIIYGNGVRAEINHDPISVSTLIPTICSMIGCSAPNASTAQPLRNLK